VCCLELCPSAFCSELIAVVFSLLSYFVCMIIALTAAFGAMIGLSNFSTFEGVRHYSRPVLEHSRPALERNITASNSEPRLFMSVPDTKDTSRAKNAEDDSVAATEEKTDAKKAGPTSAKCSPISATTTMAMKACGAMPTHIVTGYSVHFPTGDPRWW
jgi:hypothetical protein